MYKNRLKLIKSHKQYYYYYYNSQSWDSEPECWVNSRGSSNGHTLLTVWGGIGTGSTTFIIIETSQQINSCSGNRCTREQW